MASKYHPGRPCQECILCGSKHKYHAHFGAFTTEHRNFIYKHYEGNIADDSCICKADQKEAKEHCNDPNYIPRWKKHKESIINKCMHNDCNADSSNARIIMASFMPNEMFTKVLNLDDFPHEIMLCTTHYHQLYAQYNSPDPCPSCGMKPKRGTCFIRHSPNPEMISKHLSENTGISIQLTSNDRICSTCYKTHLTILHAQEYDELSLVETLKELRHKLHTCRASTKQESAILEVAIHVGNEFLSDRAMLLPEAYQLFLGLCGHDAPGDDTACTLSIESKEGSVKPSSRWLHQLIFYLHSHLSYKCVHRKFGTILYKKGGNLLTSLS